MNYIYALCDPRDNQIRYIGKTTRPHRRYLDHLTEKHKFHRVHWIQSLVSIGLKPAMIILEEVPENVNWEDRERYWIKHYRDVGGNLTNGTDGGDHPPSGKGEKRPKTKAWQDKISAWLIDHNRSPQMREVSRRNGINNKGRKPTAEQIAKMSASHKGKIVPDAASIERFKRNMQKVHRDANHFRKLRDGIHNFWNDPVRSAAARAAIAQSNKRRRRH